LDHLLPARRVVRNGQRGSPQPRRGRHKLHLNQQRIGRKLLAAVVPLLKVTAIRARGWQCR